MKTLIFASAALAVAAHAQADFSYKITRKAAGAMAAMAAQGPQQSMTYYRGQKNRTDTGDVSTIIDFGSQTVTTINNGSKTYTVKKFSDFAADAPAVEAKVDVKETGGRKAIDGFNAKEVLMTMDVDVPQARQMGPVRVEMHIWVSSEVPGADQVREFYRRNAANFPWAALSNGVNPGLAKAMSDLQRKMATLDGVPVETVVTMNPPSGGSAMPQMPRMTSAQNAQMAQARARLEAMVAQGGPGAAMAKQALDRMPGGSAPAGAPGSSGGMIEITMDSTDFSTAPIPDSTFDIPAGYQKGN